MREAAVVGIGRTAYTRKSGRTGLAMAAEAARAALADAGLTSADVDGITCFSTGDPASPLRVGPRHRPRRHRLVDEHAGRWQSGGDGDGQRCRGGDHRPGRGRRRVPRARRQRALRQGHRGGHRRRRAAVRRTPRLPRAAAVVRHVGPAPSARLRLDVRGPRGDRDEQPGACGEQRARHRPRSPVARPVPGRPLGGRTVPCLRLRLRGRRRRGPRGHHRRARRRPGAQADLPDRRRPTPRRACPTSGPIRRRCSPAMRRHGCGRAPG